MQHNVFYQIRYENFVQSCGEINGFGWCKPNDKNYYEFHHIIPRCVGGNNQEENIVVLTPRQHFIAHWMLTKVWPNSRKMKYALAMMCMKKDRKLKSKEYEISREASRKASLGRKVSKETRKKISESKSGFKMSEESRKNMSIAQFNRPKEINEKMTASRIGMKHSEETKRKISAIHKGVSKSESHKLALRNVNIGKTLSDETKQKISAIHKDVPKNGREVKCPHCSKVGYERGMKRWHFDRCEMIIENENHLSKPDVS